VRGEESGDRRRRPGFDEDALLGRDQAVRRECLAARDAVLQWKYTPTTLNGVPVDVIMTVTVNFTLQ